MSRYTLRIAGLAAWLVMLGQGVLVAEQEEPQKPDAAGKEEALRGRRPGMRGRALPVRGRRERMLPHLVSNPSVAKQLGLSEEQRTAIHDALEENREKMDAMRKQLTESAVEQGRMIMAEETDEAALMAVIEKTGQIRTEIAKLVVRPLLIIKKTLTPEQMKEARKVLDERWRARQQGERNAERERPPRRERKGRPPAPEQPEEDRPL